MRADSLWMEIREKLKSAGIADAETDSVLLMEHCCGMNRAALYAHGDEEPDEALVLELMKAVEKRCAHIPLQLITGTQDFMGLAFRVKEGVLIPRYDTEVLVEEALRELHDGMKILDVCSGSGCILLSLLHYSNDCSGVGLDISDAALSLAAENSAQLGEENAVFLKSDLFSVLKPEEKFDILVSNPPYIPSGDIAGLMEEVREHEPQLALDGGEDGLAFYRRLAAEAKGHLSGGAWLFFEIGAEQGSAVCEIFTAEGYSEVETIKDLAGLDRVVKCTWIKR